MSVLRTVAYPSFTSHASPFFLFDGKDLSRWAGAGAWEVKDGAATVGKGDITTKDSFGPDYQLHVEFATPEKVSGSGQGRGNSGVFLANRYEVQVLDSFGNRTYFDGQCAAIYKESPPMVKIGTRVAVRIAKTRQGKHQARAQEERETFYDGLIRNRLS